MPSITDDYRIDAVLAGSDIRWDPAEAGKPVGLTYSFMSALPVYADPAQDGNNFSTMTDAQKIASEILTTLSSQFDITFTENPIYAILWPTPVWQ